MRGRFFFNFFFYMNLPCNCLPNKQYKARLNIVKSDNLRKCSTKVVLKN